MKSKKDGNSSQVKNIRKTLEERTNIIFKTPTKNLIGNIKNIYNIRVKMAKECDPSRKLLLQESVFP